MKLKRGGKITLVVLTVKLMSRIAISILTALFASGCDVSDEGAFCQNEFQCEYQCSRVNECLGASGGREIRLNWTINGVPPTPSSPAPCAGVSALEVRLESDSLRDDVVSYFPVPCDLGQVYYDQMPNRFVNLLLLAKDENGATIAVGNSRVESASNILTIDLNL